MVQTLDYFRRLYKQETGEEHSNPPSAAFLMQPTWNYVCWLEGRLDTYEKEPLPDIEMTTYTYTPLYEDLLDFLRARFPKHTFTGDKPKSLFIDGARVDIIWTHPVEEPDPSTKDYLKDLLAQQVQLYLEGK